jgi:hypothetical protein
MTRRIRIERRAAATSTCGLGRCAVPLPRAQLPVDDVALVDPPNVLVRLLEADNLEEEVGFAWSQLTPNDTLPRSAM